MKLKILKGGVGLMTRSRERSTTTYDKDALEVFKVARDDCGAQGWNRLVERYAVAMMAVKHDIEVPIKYKPVVREVLVELEEARFGAAERDLIAETLENINFVD